MYPMIRPRKSNEIDVVGALDLTVSLGRDHDPRSGFGDLVAQMVGIVGLVADRGAGSPLICALLGILIP